MSRPVEDNTEQHPLPDQGRGKHTSPADSATGRLPSRGGWPWNLISVLAGIVLFAASVALAVYAGSVEAAGPFGASPAVDGIGGQWLVLAGLIGLLALAIYPLLISPSSRDRLDPGTVTSQATDQGQLSLAGNNETGSGRSQNPLPTGPAVGYTEFREHLHRHWNHCRRQSSYLALTMIEVDDLGPLTDAFGQDRINRRIRDISRSLESLTATHGGVLACQIEQDRPGRFAALFPQTAPEKALQIAEELRLSVEDLGFDRPPPSRGVMTASVGSCIVVPAHQITRDRSVAIATRALARAKRRGRNRIEAELLDPARSFPL